MGPAKPPAKTEPNATRFLTLEHLLVDLDGTLLGNKNIPLSMEFVAKALKHLRQYKGWKRAASTLVAINNEFRRPSPDQRNDERIVKIFAERMAMTELEARAVIRDHLSVIFPSLKKYFYPMKGAVEFLDWAKAKYKLTLATNPVWPKSIIELRVSWANLDPAMFNLITHAGLMTACKPDPLYYNGVLEQLKTLPENCLLIGNDLQMDLPAVQVGIPVFIVGDSKKLETLEVPKNKFKTPAWRGSFDHLKALLEG